MDYIKPPFKWAGGKSKLLSRLKEHFPDNAFRFIEPFFGAGSVGLNVNYPHAIVNDVNDDLMHAWSQIKDSPEELIQECRNLFGEESNTKDQFHVLRNEFNECEINIRKAALFIYLNRHCFNGICRYNSKGKFNTSFGGYEKPYLPENEVRNCSKKIQDYEFHCKDFREVFAMVRPGDVVYCDPPYIPVSKTASFVSYSKQGFTEDDHRDLAKCAYDCISRGAVAIVSNSCSSMTRDIYITYYKPEVHSIDVRRVISAKGDSRQLVKEYIIVYKGNF